MSNISELEPQHSYLAQESSVFAQLDSLDTFRAKIKELHDRIGTTVFYEKQDSQGEYVYFNYRFMSDEAFPELRADDHLQGCERFVREARGVAFDRKTGKCASRGLHKFFNIGEKKETQQDRIDLTRRHHVLEKLDGSMCAAMLSTHIHETSKYPGFSVIRFRSKMGFETSTSTLIENFVYGSKDRRTWPRFDLSKPESEDNAVFEAVRAWGKLKPFIDDRTREGYVRLALYWLRRDCTPIFEFVSPSQRIVLDYQQTDLVLLAIRHNRTGQYMKYDDLVVEAQRFAVPVVKAWDLTVTADSAGLASSDIAEVVSKIKDMTDVEGFVIRFEDDGTMHKCKTAWYASLHGYCTRPGSVVQSADAWRAALDGSIDDLIGAVPSQEIKDQLRTFNSKVWQCLSITAQKLREELDQSLLAIGAKSTEGGQVNVKLSREQMIKFSERINGLKISAHAKGCIFMLLREPKTDARQRLVTDLLKKLRAGSKAPHAATVDMLQEFGNQGQPIDVFAATPFEANVSGEADADTAVTQGQETEEVAEKETKE